MSKYIEIGLAPDGSIKIEAHGYKGKGCEEEINGILKELGVEASEGEHKREYYERESQRISRRLEQKG